MSLKLKFYDHAKNTMQVVDEDGQEITFENALTHAQRKKIERSIARLHYKAKERSNGLKRHGGFKC